MIYVTVLELGPWHERTWRVIYTGLDKFKANDIMDRAKEMGRKLMHPYYEEDLNVYVIEHKCEFEDDFEQIMSDFFK